MTADPLAAWWVWPILVERFTGTGARGDVYATGVTINGAVDDTTKLVRGSDGQRVLSSSRIAFPAGTAAIPAGSRVTLPATFGDNRRTIVLAASVGVTGLPTPDHVELALQ